MPDATSAAEQQPPGAATPVPVASLVIPAHNESSTIQRLLTSVLAGSEPNEFEVLVVCNGCSDETARLARAIPSVRVLEITEASKHLALRRGDASARVFPRLYIDADVVVDATTVRQLAAAVGDGMLHACAPTRRLDRSNLSLLVRWYLDVWECLPQVRTALFGRGVVALSAEGHRRVAALPERMSDDLSVSEAFDTSEYRILPDAVVVIYPARSLRALLARRIRVATGNLQMDEQGARAPQSTTRMMDLATMIRRDPWCWPKVACFGAVALVAQATARSRARRGDFHTWDRDESSRQ